MCFLRYKTFHIAQIRRIDLLHISAGNFYRSLPHLPESHQQFEQCRFAGSGASVNADNFIFRNCHGNVFQNRLLPISKCHIFHFCSMKIDFFFSRYFLHYRAFIQNIQNTASCRKCILQRCSQRSQRNHRTERTHQRESYDQTSLKPYKFCRQK